MAKKIKKIKGSIGSKYGSKRKPNKKGQHKMPFQKNVFEKAKKEVFGIGNQK